ncbi:hypothetical protein Ocin01_00748 [Orchesella cincta]|uniref:Uncharacterized protein n=1 Tax=Orchesella cincta TaxID=48709 RepID=A0A1D2NKW0_ORCCI|nr:hypothetical protein Ocin01_00748 [Orchesella cincta]
MNTFLLFLVLQAVAVTKSTGDDENKLSSGESDNTIEKFEYIRKEPGNELGIFTKIIAHIHRKANQTTDEWRLNRDYLPDDLFESLKLRCEEKESETGSITWSGCESDEKGLFAYATWGVPEPKDKTITYLELEFKPFKRKKESGVEEVCILEEVYKDKAYIVLKTYSELSPSSNVSQEARKDTGRVIFEHQLDSFGENFLDIFEDKIDVDAIYNFGSDESFDRDPPYECFLSIGSSESVSVIEAKCDFFCPDPTGLSPEELENVLLQAKREADEAEVEKWNQEDSSEVETNHDEL